MATMIFADRVKETTNTSGTSATITLNGADLGYQGFASVMEIGDTCYYCEENGAVGQWETGIATLTSVSPTILTKEALHSNEGEYACTFVGGIKNVFLTQTTDAFKEISIKQVTAVLGQNQSVSVEATTVLNVYEATGDNSVTATRQWTSGPAMTSPTSASQPFYRYDQGGESIYTSGPTEPATAGRDPWKMFSRVTGWDSFIVAGDQSAYLGKGNWFFAPNGLTIAYAFAEAKLIERMTLTLEPSTYWASPKTFNVYASNSMTLVAGGVSNWTLLHTSPTRLHADWVAANYSVSVDFGGPQFYRYFMIVVTSENTNSWDSCSISEIGFYTTSECTLLAPAVDYKVVRSKTERGLQTNVITRLKAGIGQYHLIDYI